jgi:hypothetical protein
VVLVSVDNLDAWEGYPRPGEAFLAARDPETGRWAFARGAWPKKVGGVPHLPAEDREEVSWFGSREEALAARLRAAEVLPGAVRGYRPAWLPGPAVWRKAARREGDVLEVRLPSLGFLELSLGPDNFLALRADVRRPEGVPPAEFHAGLALLLSWAAREAGFPFPWLRCEPDPDGEGVHFLPPFSGRLGPEEARLSWADPLEEAVTLPEAAKIIGVTPTALRRKLARGRFPKGAFRRAKGAWLLLRREVEKLKRKT